MSEPDPTYCAFCDASLYKQKGGTPSFVGSKKLGPIDMALDAKNSPSSKLDIDSNVMGYWVGFCDQCDSKHDISNGGTLTDIADQMQFGRLVEATQERLPR